MEMSGQIHVTAALSTRKKPPAPIEAGCGPQKACEYTCLFISIHLIYYSIRSTQNKQGKGRKCPCYYVTRQKNVQFDVFLTLETKGEWSVSCYGRFSDTHGTGGSLDTITGLAAVEKTDISYCCQESNYYSPVVQSEAQSTCTMSCPSPHSDWVPTGVRQIFSNECPKHCRTTYVQMCVSNVQQVGLTCFNFHLLNFHSFRSCWNDSNKKTFLNKTISLLSCFFHLLYLFKYKKQPLYYIY
jgi:hypothetical protein